MNNFPAVSVPTDHCRSYAVRFWRVVGQRIEPAGLDNEARESTPLEVCVRNRNLAAAGTLYPQRPSFKPMILAWRPLILSHCIDYNAGRWGFLT